MFDRKLKHGTAVFMMCFAFFVIVMGMPSITNAQSGGETPVYFDRVPTAEELENIFADPQGSSESFSFERTQINSPTPGASDDQRLFGEPKPNDQQMPNKRQSGSANASQSSPVSRSVPLEQPGRSGGKVASGEIDIKMIFELNSAALPSAYIDRIDPIGDLMQKKPASIFLIVGHTDTSGSADHNLLLSLKRAKSVRDYFIAKHGIMENRLVAQGRGEEQPRPEVAGTDETNRRVSIIRMN